MVVKYMSIFNKNFLAKLIRPLMTNFVFVFIYDLFSSNKITILAYHRVLDVPSDDEYPYDLDLISTNTEEFSQQIKYLKIFFNPITIAQLIDMQVNEIKLPKRTVIVTFDDGFDDNYLNAYPILKESSFPATMFISTHYINTGEQFWFDKLTNVILTTEKTEISIPELDLTYIHDGTLSKRRSIALDILSKLKSIKNEKRLVVLDYIYTHYKPGFETDNLENLSRPLNWEQVKIMSDDIIEIGSHSVTHPILSSINKGDLYSELKESKVQIEQKIKTDVLSISYPVGSRKAYSPEVKILAKAIGYKIGFSYETGVNKFPIPDMFSLKRLHVERYTTFSRFVCMLFFPKLFKY